MPNAAPSTTSSYELTGPPGAPVVAVLGGISASRQVTGWWPEVVGDGRAIDTSRVQVLGLDYLDGGRRPDGRPERAVSTYDQADALVHALDELGVERIHALVGASYGGMVALAFGERYPARVEQLVVISAPAGPHPMSIALRTIQRRVVELGLDTGRAFDAMVLARALAMTTYRSADEFGRRFTGESSAAPGTTDVEAYLTHQGLSFARRFTPERFLALSLSADTHRVDPSQGRTPAIFVAADNDTIVPREQMEYLAASWGGPGDLRHVESQIGHDAFLAEPDAIGRILRNALESTVPV